MGAIYIAGHRIRDHKPFGRLTVAQILAHSSDVGTIKLGLRLGAPKLYEYIRAYGFGRLSGIDLPGESRGLLRRLENWTPLSVGSISMGQEIGVTPVQMVTAVSAIANGGLLYRPHVVQALRRGAEQVAVERPPPVRVIRATTAATMRRMLEGVVLEGTGRRARLDGYTAAGKTGTSQKFDPAAGRYSATQFIASFAGFAPVNDPAVTILVQLDSPVGPHEGGVVAAPVFKRIAEQVLAYRNIPHDVPFLPAQLRALRSLDQDAAAAVLSDLSDFDPMQIDASEVAGQFAQPLAQSAIVPTAKHASLLPPTMGFAEGEGVLVPNLAGKNVREVTEISLRAGLNPVLIGTGVVQEQDPRPGAVVRHGGSVTVRFSRAPARSRQ